MCKKEFISGLAFPATIFPIIYLLLPHIINIKSLSLDQFGSLASALQFAIFVPWIWGIWNVIYFKFLKQSLSKDRNIRLAITGAILGFLLALVGVFKLRLPELIFGLTGSMQYLALVIAPIIYAIFWRYIVGYFNNLLGLKD